MLLRCIYILWLIFLVSAQDDQCSQCVQAGNTWCDYRKTCEGKRSDCAVGVKLALNCPRIPDPTYAYNDSFARYYITPLIGGLFLDTPEPCLKLVPHISYYKNVRVQCAKEQTDVHCYGYTAWDSVEKAIIIVIVGAGSEMQGLDLTYSSLLQKKIGFFENGHLIKYFNDAFLFLWNGGMEQQVRTLKYQYPDYKIYVTGHSMGASLATVAAAYLVKWNMWAPEDLRLITMGQPRTGDYEFAQWHDATFPYSYRIISHRDPVPHSPPRIGADAAFHHRYEVWYGTQDQYDNDMAVGQPYTICQEADGDYCSNTVSNKGGSDHLFYFNLQIKEWGLAGCPAANLTRSK